MTTGTITRDTANATQTQHQGRTSRRTIILTLVATVISILHHVDHVLRADHSGWPFIESFNPFTISVIGAYSVIGFVLFVRGRVWLKFSVVSVAYFFTQGAHIFLETPEHQYITWAANASPVSNPLGQPNLLDIASPAMGAYAVMISLALSAVLIALIVSTYLDARRAMR